VNVGNLVVTTALNSRGGIRPFITAGMDLKWLRSQEGQAVFKGEDRLAYQHLLQHYDRHGKLNKATFRKDHPSYRFAGGDWKHDEVLDQAREVIRRWLVLDALNAADDVGRDLDTAVAVMVDRAARLRSGVLSPASSGMEMLNAPEFDSFIENFVGDGIPFGIKEIDAQYGGAQAGQLITLVGRQKSTKSTLLAWSSIAAWETGHEVVFYNVELDMQFMRQKLLSIGAHASPELMRRGPGADPVKKSQWEQDKRKLREFYTRLGEEGVPFRIAQKFSRFTVEDVAHDIDAYQPHAVYIDGFYFMEDQEGDSAAANHKAIEHIAGDLKALAMEKRVAIYVSTQAQEKQQGKKKTPGIEARTIQGGTGLLKASDLVLGIDVDEHKHVWINQIHNRYGQIDPVKIGWDWDKMEMKMLDADYSEFDV
jgi:hypothetical protein